MMMYFQQVINGELINHPVSVDQVPSDNNTYFPVGDMNPPDYDPYKQTLFDEGMQVDDEGMPYRLWSILPFPEIEIDIWEDTRNRARLELDQSSEFASQADWLSYRSELSTILANAEAEAPSGTPDSVVWPAKPE
jgi:hypothetical protein